MKKTFKIFVKEIAEAPNREWAINNIFYGEDGIDMAFQREQISYADSELLLKLIENLKEADPEEETEVQEKTGEEITENMTQYEIYNIMYRKAQELEIEILKTVEQKGHTISSNGVFVAVGSEADGTYFVDFEARNKSGNYYRVYGNYTFHDMKRAKIL